MKENGDLKSQNNVIQFYYHEKLNEHLIHQF